MEVFFVLGLIGAAVWYFAWHRPRRHTMNDAAQAWVEGRVLNILQNDPSAPDELVAILVRDEIVNARARDPLLFAWATPETVARIKRTALRIVIDRQRATQLPMSETKATRGQRKCRACGTKNRPSRERCRKCYERMH